MLKRIILNILLFVSILVLPWWVSVFLALAVLYYLRSFNEIVVYGLVWDILYGKFSPTFQILDYRLTLLFLFFLLSSFFIKKRLKFYDR
jgi:hypothetical protein